MVEKQTSLTSSWSQDGLATFHQACWTKLKMATRGSTDEMSLSDLEVKLVEEASKTAEFHDSDSHIAAEAKRIAELLRKTNYAIAFTGAGISTAAGIGDFRGIHGKWTDRDKVKDHGKKGIASKGGHRKRIGELRPTYTHEAIVKLLEMGILKYVISQNTDGLHRLSGIPEDAISELHGNAFVQKCEKCEKRYMYSGSHRDQANVRANVPEKKCERCHINHRTGRICEDKKCGGYLMNTIINFGDYLEGPILRKAEENATNADFVLCLGSTLMVSPANDLVEMGQSPQRLVICNRQKTPYDKNCTQKDADGHNLGCRLYGDCDKLMRAVMVEVLGPEAHQTWEDQRPQRMAVYDKRRS